MENLLINAKIYQRHIKLEKKIKELDPNQDLSRSAIFTRAVSEAADVDNWKIIQELIPARTESELQATPSNYQAKQLEEHTAKTLQMVTNKITEELGLKRLQQQYLLLLLLTNYLQVLEKKKSNTHPIVLEDDSEMFKILYQIMVAHADEQIAEIKSIMKEWKKNHE